MSIRSGFKADNSPQPIRSGWRLQTAIVGKVMTLLCVCDYHNKSVNYVSNLAFRGTEPALRPAMLLDVAARVRLFSTSAFVASFQFGADYETKAAMSAVVRCCRDVTSFEYRTRITGDVRNRAGDVARQISVALIKETLMYKKCQ
jgi:hypothetical protein